jgi:5-deoxy-5-amino-3-dehydroquinate synthase
MREVTVPLPAGDLDRSYPVIVGHGAVARLGEVLAPLGARRVAVVSQAGLPFAVADDLLVGAVREVHRFTIGDGEEHKTLGTVGELCRGFARAGITRADVVVAVGGGMVTDVAGFAAASYHRGIPVVHVPTSLLGMVDAAIGGKTGVNLPEGKNLVGAFWQPSGVICDLDSLATLPEREVRCGNGEMAKYHFLTGDDLAAMALEDRVARCVEIKAEVVASDEREGGRRAILNYGHTLAHALEIASAHRIAHGEAVAIGLVFAARLAERLGRIDAARVAAHQRVVEGVYGLSSAVPAVGSADDLLELMGRDKKAVDGLTFVLDGADGVEPVPGVDSRAVRDVLVDALAGR